MSGVIVTGAASGIGRACAEVLVAEGRSVMLWDVAPSVVDVASRVSEFRRSSFEVEHRLSVDGELAVEGAETRVWAARSKDDPEKIAGIAIPADVIAKFTAGAAS